ncbi:hypothetical protein TUM22923_10740 [Polynucleobacter sp. TUM22923]|jgi:hypothetical protein|uniref:DUF3306 domain-containing protein n=1 Tax=Polynucleobacter sp. TUM22923 TaxID=3022126 RepID=UPI002572D6F6|nr:DUF3306 domain-containing protein [Polynucleobacter sp. TUM22923]BDX21753.1 hypothetical protein TUM22923_10740 [Polynucleobacter sp. TUM22923]
MADGFLSRWSRRKSGEQLEPEKSAVPEVKPVSAPPVEADLAEPQETPAPMTLEDADKIDRFAPDFSAFMDPGVDPAVQQAAMKKMFSDPHFNVMDGLDIYIDDYSKPDPIPLEMLKRMVQSDMLNIFRKDPKDAKDIKESNTADGSKIAASVPAPESNALILPTPEQTDITSTHSLANSGVDSPDLIPTDKKIS